MNAPAASAIGPSATAITFFFIFVAAPRFFDPMFVKPPDVIGIPLGLILFVIAIMAMGAGFFFIRKIVDIEV